MPVIMQSRAAMTMNLMINRHKEDVDCDECNDDVDSDEGYDDDDYDGGNDGGMIGDHVL